MKYIIENEDGVLATFVHDASHTLTVNNDTIHKMLKWFRERSIVYRAMYDPMYEDLSNITVDFTGTQYEVEFLLTWWEG